jgi:hypothetical protein
MNAGTKLGTVPLDVDRRHASACIERRLDRARGIAEYGHQPVPKALHDLAASREDRRLDRFVDLAQESDRRSVSCSQRPLGEAHEIGEEDHDVHFASTPALSFCQPLPALQNRGSELSGNPGLLRPEGGELAECDIDGTTPSICEAIVDLLLAERPFASPARRIQ